MLLTCSTCKLNCKGVYGQVMKMYFYFTVDAVMLLINWYGSSVRQ